MSVALLSMLLLSACQDPSPPEPPARVADLARAPVDLTTGCPAPTKDLPYPPTGRLPEGSVVVRACPAAKEYPWEMPAAPTDALTVDPDRIVDVVNGLRPLPARTICTMQGGTTADLWFGYPGGRATAVHIDTGGCGLTYVSAPGNGREGGLDGKAQPLTEFTRALIDQRAAESTPHRRWPQPRCNPSGQPGSMVRLRPGTPLARGTYCVLEDGLHWRSARIPHSLLDAISADLSQSGRGGHCHHPFAVLMLITAWGDRETLSQDRCTILYPAVGGSLGRWLPSPEVRQALDGLRLGAQYPQRRPDGTIVR